MMFCSAEPGMMSGGGAGNDIFSWLSGDMVAGDVDSILDFSLNSDMIYLEPFAGMDATALVTEITDGRINVSATSANAIAITTGANHTINITLEDAGYAEWADFTGSTEEAAKANFLLQILSASG